MCGIDLQKSNYSDYFYVNYFYFIGNLENVEKYPIHYDSDIQGRIAVMSVKDTFQGNKFLTAMIEYKEYTEAQLCPFFEKAFEEKILPPIQ